MCVVTSPGSTWAARSFFKVFAHGASEDGGGRGGSLSRPDTVSTSKAARPSSVTAVTLKTQIKDGICLPLWLQQGGRGFVTNRARESKNRRTKAGRGIWSKK